MLGEYNVGRSTRHCYELDRPLRDGEVYYSVVIAKGDNFERRDYSAEAWSEPPEDAIGVWKNRMPTQDQRKLVLAPDEVLIGILHQMADVPEKAKLRYLLALMLMRKKVVRASIQPAQIPSETDETEETLWVETGVEPNLIGIPVCPVSGSESEQLLEELNELLYCEATEIEENQ